MDQRFHGNREEELGVNHLVSVESEKKSRGREEIYTLLHPIDRSEACPEQAA